MRLRLVLVLFGVLALALLVLQTGQVQLVGGSLIAALTLTLYRAAPPA